jgi:hypothetical protein
MAETLRIVKQLNEKNCNDKVDLENKLKISFCVN